MHPTRVATAEDAPALAQMLNDFNKEFGDPTPGPAVLERRVREFIAGGVKTYLLVGNAADGFGQLDFVRSIWADVPVGHLDELYVAPALRGEGRGRALMEAILGLARERHAAGMEVVTGEDDTAARGLYEAFGFANEIEGSENARSLFYELDF